jgi:DNA primase large subunit
MEIVKPQWKKPPPSANDVVSTLPLYRSAPSLEVRLEDFELYAIDRLRGNFSFFSLP